MRGLVENKRVIWIVALVLSSAFCIGLILAGLTAVGVMSFLPSSKFPTLEPAQTLFPTPDRTPDLTPVSVAASPTATENFVFNIPTITPNPTATLRRELLPSSAFGGSNCPRQQVCITFPRVDSVLRGPVEFRGTATRANFDYYKFEFKTESATDWNFLTRFKKPVVNNVLMEWHTRTVPRGIYLVRLIVVDKTGNYWPEFAQVRVIVER